ncbi:MAG: 50S ribosomal protein L29 [Syntrophobacterales bacterium]|nr:50S ribosomal protein L29 [Syntrophobacterales bacterium]
MNKRANELRNLTKEELLARLKDLKESLFSLKIQHSREQLQNTAQLKKTRREIARVLTILRERELQGEGK